MLKTKLDNILHPWVGVEHSPRLGLQNLDIPSTFERGWHEVTGEDKKAFTLAEVLITLGIIGVVAAMTIPTLMVDINTKQWATASNVFKKKLNESLKTMNTQQVIAGYTTTLSFVEELSKHFKINKICKNDELQNCFSETIYWGAGEATPEEIDMTKVKQAKDFGLEDWGTELIGVQFANGVAGLVAYNPACSGDPYSNQFEGTGCISVLYDTSGAKNPNSSGKDIGNYGAISKLGKGCFAEVNGLCLAMQPQPPTPVTKAECEAMKSTHGITECSLDSDYWAGAVKLCGHVNKMATMADLGKIAAYVYNVDSIGAKEDVNNLTFDPAKAAELGLPSSDFFLWSDEADSSFSAFGRGITATAGYTYWSHGGEGFDRDLSNSLAICLGE